MAAGKQVNIDIKTKADTSGADAAAKSLQRISDTGSKGMKEADKAAKNTAYSIGNVANQFQDITVQVDSGTSALRVFTQQAPQIASAFGPYGAIGGAFLALGAVVFKTLTETGKQIRSVEDQAKDLAEAVQNVIEISSNLSNSQNDYALKAIKSATDQANLLSNAFANSETSAANFATRTIQNMEKVRQAMVELDKLNGKQVDSVDEIKNREAAASAARLNQFNLDIEAQNKRAEEARSTTDLATQELLKVTAISSQKQAQIQVEDQRLQKLREQRDVLKAQREEMEATEKAALQTMLKNPTPGSIAAYGTVKASNQTNLPINQQQTDVIQSQITLTESRITDLEKSIQEGGAITNAVIEAAQKVSQASISQADIFQSVATEIESLKQSFNADEIKARLSTVKEASAAVSTDIKGLIDTIQPTSEAQKASLEGLKSVTADNQVAANESLATIAQLNALARSLPASETQKQDVINKLLQKVQQLQNDLNATNNQVNKLTQQRTTPLKTN